MADVGDFLEIGGNDDDGKPGIQRLGDKAVDIGTGADIDTSGRILGNQQLTPGRQPAGDDDLLLIAAG